MVDGGFETFLFCFLNTMGKRKCSPKAGVAKYRTALLSLEEATENI